MSKYTRTHLQFRLNKSSRNITLVSQKLNFLTKSLYRGDQTFNLVSTYRYYRYHGFYRAMKDGKNTSTINYMASKKDSLLSNNRKYQKFLKDHGFDKFRKIFKGKKESVNELKFLNLSKIGFRRQIIRLLFFIFHRYKLPNKRISIFFKGFPPYKNAELRFLVLQFFQQISLVLQSIHYKRKSFYHYLNKTQFAFSPKYNRNKNLSRYSKVKKPFKFLNSIN